MALRQERKHRGEVSLEEPIGTDRDGNEITVGDVLGTDEDAVFGETEARLNGERLRSVVDTTLSGREHTVIVLRFGLDGGEPLAQREVASILRISRSYVSRIETRALIKLRAAFGDKRD